MALPGNTEQAKCRPTNEYLLEQVVSFKTKYFFHNTNSRFKTCKRVLIRSLQFPVRLAYPGKTKRRVQIGKMLKLYVAFRRTKFRPTTSHSQHVHENIKAHILAVSDLNMSNEISVPQRTSFYKYFARTTLSVRQRPSENFFQEKLIKLKVKKFITNKLSVIQIFIKKMDCQ